MIRIGFFFKRPFSVSLIRKAGSRWACGTAALSAILWFRVEGPGLGSSGLGPCKSATLRDYNVNCRLHRQSRTGMLYIVMYVLYNDVKHT